MLVLLSPAKTLDNSPTTNSFFSQPQFIHETEQLVTNLKEKSANDLKKLMKISDKIADLNVVRYQNFSLPFNTNNAKQAIFMFRGDVYTGLNVELFDEKDLEFAQKTLRILSGLYGILKPMDLMQPYRLEMGTKLSTDSGKNLYEFWESKLTSSLNAEIDNPNTLVINLASKEYFNSIQQKNLKGKLVHIDFKEWRGDKYKIIAFNAKKARGMMSQYIVKNRISDLGALKAFDMDNYTYNEELSEKDRLVFVR